MTAFDLHRIAPRLARACDQILELRRQETRHERWLTDERLRLARLIAHRDLQLARSYSTRSLSYIRLRQAKLKNAQLQLADLERREGARIVEACVRRQPRPARGTQAA